MENTKKNNASFRVLEKIENLMGEDSNILVLLDDQKLNSVDKKDKNIEKINKKNNKINEIKELINKLHSEASKIENIFNNYKTSDFKNLIDIFGINIHFDEDYEILNEKLPVFLKDKNEEIENLSKEINSLEDEVITLTSKISDFENQMSEALVAQKSLIELIKESVNQTLNKTREEVISILRMVSFDEKEAMEAAKLILFPEDELIPYFKKNKVFEELENKINNLTIDISEEKPILEDKKEELNVESQEIKEKQENLETKEEITNMDDIFKTDSVSFDNDDEIYKTFLNDEDNAPIELSELNLKDVTIDTDSFEKEPNTPISINELTDGLINKEDNLDESINLDLVSKEVVEEQVDIDKFLNLIEKNKEDASLIDGLFKGITETKLEEFIKKIKSLDISIKSVPLLTYKHDLDNYLKNIKTLKDNGYQFSDMDIEKFSSSLYLTSNDQIIANLVVLKKYNINILKSNGKLCFKLLSLETNKLLDNLNLFVEMGDIEIVRNNVEILVKDVKDICERILFCKNNSIPYIEEKGHKFIFRAFIYEKKLLEELLESKIELNNIKNNKDVNDYLRSVSNSNLVNILDNSNDYNPALDNEKLEKEYNKVIIRLEDKVKLEDEYYTLDNIIFSKNNTIKNIINILNNANNVEIKDILIVALLYNSHKDIDSCEKVINTFNN